MILHVTLLKPETDLSVSVYWSTIFDFSNSCVYEDAVAGIEAHMCLRPSITLTWLDLAEDDAGR